MHSNICTDGRTVAVEVRQRIAWSTTPQQLQTLLDREDWPDVAAYIASVKGYAVLLEVLA